MSAIGRTIAAAVVTTLNAATLSQSVTFTRSYVPREQLEDHATLACHVVYAGQRASADSRSCWLHEYDIDIGIQKKFSSDVVTESDTQADLLEEIVDLFKTTRPSGTAARMTGVDFLYPSGVPDHMTNYKQFTGVVRLTFRLVRTNS